MRFAIVASRFNEEVTTGLLRSARAFLAEKKARVDEADIHWAPGAFEIPLIARALARTRAFDGVVCLGCVIKGDTAHFEFISLGATIGLMQGMMDTGTPISFGILTTYTEDQAALRSGPDDAHNKGREAAAACWETAQVLRAITERA